MLLANGHFDLTSLPSVSLQECMTLPNVAGIYFVCAADHAILYIGAAKSLCLRWRHHNHYPQFVQHGSVRIAWMPMHSYDVMYEAEREFIRLFRPQYNKAHIEPLVATEPPMEALPATNPMGSTMTLGQRVEKLRKERKMNQEELAARAKISQGMLSRIERGGTPDPGATVLKGLARALGCSIDYLVDLYGDDHTEASSSMAVAAS